MLAACGYGDCSCALGPGSTPAQLYPGFDVIVTDQDRAINVHTGQKIEVYLAQRNGMTQWSEINTDNAAVLRAVPTGITAPKGVTVAGFEAVAAGTANIRATATPVCSPGQACPQFAMLFEVTVTVS